MDATEHIIIVGAGLAGLATSLALHRQGLRSLVLESSDTLRSSGFFITLASNAWRALEALGAAQSLRSHHVQLQDLVFYSLISGTTTLRLNLTARGKCGVHEARCVKRNILLEALAKELPEGTIRFSSKLTSIEDMGNYKLLRLEDGSTLKAKILIGCDGVKSVVAKWMGHKKPTCHGRYALRGLATFQDGHGVKPDFTIYFGKGFRSGLIPSDEKTLYWFYTWSSCNKGEEFGKDGKEIIEAVLRKMKSPKVPQEFLQAVETSEPSSVAWSPLKFRSAFELLWAYISKGNVSLAGDAFHPMTPYIGQGGCAALEDGVVLAKCLGEALLREGKEEEERRIEEALKRYAKKRRWRSFKLAATSYALGYVQESGSSLINLLRDKVLSGFMAERHVDAADFDCGQL